MSNQFDPYYEWLGIPPKDQPPNHYRLLGIEIFESNANVIERAADRQMGHVRTFQSGKHSRLSQDLLNKLSAAKVCLLNPQRKTDYDSQLRAAIAPPTAASQATETTDGGDAAQASLPEMPIVRLGGKQRRKSQSSSTLMFGVALIVAFVFVVIGVFLFYPEQPIVPGPNIVDPNPNPQGNSTTVTDNTKKPTVSDAAANDGGKKNGSTSSGTDAASTTIPASKRETEPKPAPSIDIAAVQSVNEIENIPQDPATDNWPDPNESVGQRLSSAQGILHPKFAFCQSLPFSEFGLTVRELRTAGYRLVRARPFRADPVLQVAAVWWRDGIPFRVIAGGTRFEIEAAQQSLSSQGYIPVDVSTCALNSKTPADEIFNVVWMKSVSDVPSRMLLGLAKAEYDDKYKGLVNDGYFPRALWRHAVGEGPEDYRLSAILYKTLPRPEYRVFGGSPSFYKAQLNRGMPIDIGQFRMKNAVFLGGIILIGDKRRYGESHGMLPTNHLNRCQEFIAQGLQPLAISVSPGPNGQFQAASIWVEPNVGTFPELTQPAPAGNTVVSTPPRETPTPKPASDKIPVPDAAQVDAASHALREQMKTRLAASKTPVKQSALSASVLASARDETDTTKKYALLLKARDLAIDAGDAWAGVSALDLLGNTFAADAWALRLELLEKVSAKARGKAAQNQVAEAAMSLAHEASLVEQFDNAEKLIAYGRRGDVYRRYANARGKLLTQQKLLADKATEARTKLAVSPDDPAANLTYGRYLCFAKEDWNDGLPHLAKGSDAELADAAKKEVNSPGDARSLLSVTENWITWGKKNTGDEYGLVWRHVQGMLQRMLPELPAVEKSKALGQLQETMARIIQAGDIRRFGGSQELRIGEIMRLQGHSSAVTGLSVSRSGRWVVSGSQDDTIRVWDLTTAAELTRFSIGVSDINALVLSPDEDRLVAIGQGTKVVTARLSDQKVLSEFDVSNPLHQIAMSADGLRLLLMIQGSPTWAVMACNLDGKRQVALPVNGNIQSIDLSRSGTFAVVADNNNQVFVWDVERGGEPRQLAGNPTYISDLAIAPNEELVAGVSPEAIILWNPVTGEEVNRIRVPRGAQKVAFALDSRRLVASSVARDLTVIDAQLGTVIASFDARASSGSVSVCHSIAVLPDGRGAVTAGYDGTIFVWHLPE